MKNIHKGITVPYKYYDKKKNYTYYIYKNKEYTDMSKLFKSFVGSYLTYHYQVNDKECEVSNFSEVVEAVLKNYEDFTIPKKYNKEYAELELHYINKLQKDLKEGNLRDPYDSGFRYSIKDFINRKLFRFSKKVYNEYHDIKIPKKIKSKTYNEYYYVVGGFAYQSIYLALDEVFDSHLHYQFGGTKNPNNRSHLQAHNFDDLIGLLLDQTDKFAIHVFQQEYYSKQEIDFLNKLADKLNKMGYQNVNPTFDELDTTEYNYLKDNHRYISLLFHNLHYRREQRDYEKQVLKSHKI